MAGVRVTVYGAKAIAEARHVTLAERIRIGNDIVQEARADAPVVTGDYRDGITLEVDGDHVTVVDNDPDAGWKEYGTSTHAAHATLTDAARAHGKYSGVQPKGRRGYRGKRGR
jgi:hypothetical protein